jgi:hypothetical protein
MREKLWSKQSMNNQNEEPESETLDLSKPDYSFTPKGTHEWRQMGYYLVCKSCDLEHAIFIGPDKILVGVNETGQPLLKRRADLGIA